MKIVNAKEENLCIFWATRGISMKYSGKMWLSSQEEGQIDPQPWLKCILTLIQLFKSINVGFARNSSQNCLLPTIEK